MATNKRPCCICKRWFELHARAGARQRVCSAPECQRKSLSLFLSDPAVPIHNNLSERALRIVALLRKRSLFAGGDGPAQTYAELRSLLSTCLLHDVDPEEWLADVLLAMTEPGSTA